MKESVLSKNYDKNSEHTRAFYKKIQNKLIYVVTAQKAPAIINNRANANKENMDLQTWKLRKTQVK